MIEYKTTTMRAYHLKQVIELEKLIKQPQMDTESSDQKGKRHRLFLDWNTNNKAISKVLEYKESIVAYYHLILDPQLISNFYSSDSANIQTSSYLAQVSIHPNYQNQGLGTLLMKDIYLQSSQNDKTDLLLEVNSNTKAFGFYKHQSFQEIEAQVFMKKSLI